MIDKATSLETSDPTVSYVKMTQAERDKKHKLTKSIKKPPTGSLAEHMERENVIIDV